MHHDGGVTIPNAVPLGQPLVGASFGQAVRRFFQQYVGFSGRASRSEYWWAVLFTQLLMLLPVLALMLTLLAFMPTIVAAEAASSSGGSYGGDAAAILAATTTVLVVSGVVVIASLALALPMYALMWRRLQDANFHGAFALLSLVGLSIVPFVMAFFPSSPLSLRFDPATRAAAWGQPGYPAADPAHPATGAWAPPAAAPAYDPTFGQPAAPYGGAVYGGAPYGDPGEQPYGPPPASGPYDAPRG